MADAPLPRDSPDWESPEHCPFCGTALSDGGSGFIDHVEATPPCQERFDDWTNRVRNDMKGEWIG